MDLRAEERPAAAAVALELMKQLITLSSGVLALSATFIRQFRTAQVWSIPLLVVAWLLLITAIVAALDAISGIVKSRLDGNDEWSRGRGKKAASLSKWTFIAGLALFTTFALTTILAGTHSDDRAVFLRIEGKIELTDSAATVQRSQHGNREAEIEQSEK